MKRKILISILGIAIVLYFIANFSYYLINIKVKSTVSSTIDNFVSNTCIDCDWKYIKSISNKKNSFLVFIKIKNNDKNEFYQLSFSNKYELINISNEVPIYIKNH